LLAAAKCVPFAAYFAIEAAFIYDRVHAGRYRSGE
jgi:hypothetical protein